MWHQLERIKGIKHQLELIKKNDVFIPSLVFNIMSSND